MAPRILPILSQLDDIAESIAEPPSRRPFAKAVGEAGRKICDRRSANPGAANYGGALGAAVDAMCTPYWEENDYSPPEVGPGEFPGGQCEGLIYRPSGTYVVSCSSSGVPAGTVLNWEAGGACTGPITGIAPAVDGGAWTIQHAGPNQVFLVGVEFSGNLQIIPRSGVSCAQATASTQRRSATQTPVITAQNPQGFTDDCGDIPGPPVPGPTPAPDPGPISPDEEPYNDPEFGPVFPIPDLPGLPGFPGIPFRNPFGGGGDSLPGDSGEPGESVPADGVGGDGAGAEAEGEAPPGSELVGLRLDLVEVLPRFPDVGDGDYRAAAFIRMGTSDGLDLDQGGAIVRDGQFFYAEKPGLTKWSVTANVGISWLVTPFYREVN